jgi:hypothetical protein
MVGYGIAISVLALIATANALRPVKAIAGELVPARVAASRRSDGDVLDSTSLDHAA